MKANTTAKSFLAAALLALAACGSPRPEYSVEQPPGSGTWTAVAALPDWVEHPATPEGWVGFLQVGQSNLRDLAVGLEEIAARDAAREVEAALTPAVGAEDAARSAARVPGALRLVRRAARRETIAAADAIGGELVTVWTLRELPIDALLGPLSPESHEAARAAVRTELGAARR